MLETMFQQSMTLLPTVLRPIQEDEKEKFNG